VWPHLSSEGQRCSELQSAASCRTHAPGHTHTTSRDTQTQPASLSTDAFAAPLEAIPPRFGSGSIEAFVLKRDGILKLTVTGAERMTWATGDLEDSQRGSGQDL
jgi:hypothetical protein